MISLSAEVRYSSCIPLHFALDHNFQRTQAPCAWLERGGIFNIPKYYNAPGPFVQRRQTCTGRDRCPLTWLPPQDLQALTFKLIGTDGKFTSHK